jgi:hypothetical protein
MQEPELRADQLSSPAMCHLRRENAKQMKSKVTRCLGTAEADPGSQAVDGIRM